MADAGKAMMLYKGVYDSTIEYEILDVVNYNGSLYISKINNNLDYEPTLDETKWQLFLEGGTSENIQVTDTQGIVGDAGSSSFVQMLLDGIAEKVVNIINGSQVVGKATQDGNGNNIASTYIPKANILNTVEAIDANTSSDNVAGALAMKSLKTDFANSLLERRIVELWTGYVSSDTQITYTTSLSNYPSAKRLILEFNASATNNTLVIEVPQHIWGKNINFGSHNRYSDDYWVTLKVIPYQAFFDTGCKLSWENGSVEYKLAYVWLEY